MSQSHLLYHGRIAKVKFNLAGSESIKKDSYATITSYDLFRNNLPYPTGVYDAHTGTTDHSYRCQTCYNNKRTCLGHPGHIHLNYPVWNGIALSDGRKWLKLICFNCAKPIIPDSAFMNLPRAKRLDLAAKTARTGNKKCVHCKEVHPIIKKDPTEPLALIAEFYEDKKIAESKMLLPHTAGEILSRITDETVIKLGKYVTSHPRNIILWDIQVPPVTIRPDVKKMGGGRSTNSDLTTMLQILVKKNETMPAVVPQNIDAKFEKSVFEINNAYYDFIRAGGENSMESIAARLKGKTGRFRKNQMGKRVFNMCRSTIVGDPRLRIDEVGVPLIFARTIQYEECVQEFNKARLLTYVQNGRKKYPGASKIIKKISGAEFDIGAMRDIELEVGDIVLRDMIDGDPVNFNRQPSLMISNIATHRAVVTLNPNDNTLRMNVAITPMYNADFDGDAMNLIISAGLDTRNEIGELSRVSNWFISHTNSAPSIGQVEDSIIGTAELTKSNVMLDKYHAMLLFQNATFLPTFAKTPITGRACLSKMLEDTPINFTRGSTWYSPNMSAYIKYDPSEIKVVIDQGNIISGIVDKSSIGKGANGGIYHIIANEYGPDKALEVMFNMQQMAIAYIRQLGFTIGIMDLIISDSAKIEIDNISADTINKSRIITDQLHNGEIIPPIGKTVEEFYEERQINILTTFDEFIEPIMKAIDPQTNGLFKMILYGSKGKLEHALNIMSAIGQKLINGERVRQKFGFKRSLAYFPRFDTSPESRGFIANSYISGMNSTEFIFNAMAARFDLISKALSTSITGEQNRKSIKNLESIIANIYRWSVKNRNIVQFAYGEDFLDPRNVVKVRFPTVVISDAAFEKTYLHADFPEFYDIMKTDRVEYRRVFTKIEYMNLKELMSDSRLMPVDVQRIINDTIRANPGLKSATKTPLAPLVAEVSALCATIPYVLINEIQEKAGSKIPPYMMAASWLMTVLIRSYLHPNALVENGITPAILTIVIGKIKMRYALALIEPGSAVGIISAQCFSEPLTQYMLDAHTRSASGGTSKGGIKRAKEVLGAREVGKLSSPSMLIPVLPEFANDQIKVQEIANSIEVMKFSQFVSAWQIFYERFGEPKHSVYLHEAAMIAEFQKINPLMAVPGDVTRWCIRFALNKTTMILKNMSIELMVTKLRELFPETYIVYSPENAKDAILRVYMRSTMFKGITNTAGVKVHKDAFMTTIIRGVDGITNATAVKMIRSKTLPDGSIARDDNLWGISTNGTNMQGVFTNPRVDVTKVQTDAIQEIYAMLGIEASRQKVISELRNIVDVCNHRHYLTYADEMTYTGRVTSIESSGLKARETSNVLLRIGFSSPLATIEEAVSNSMEDAVTGITGPLLVGSIPRHGTLFSSFHVNKEFVQKHIKRPDDVLAALFD